MGEVIGCAPPGPVGRVYSSSAAARGWPVLLDGRSVQENVPSYLESQSVFGIGFSDEVLVSAGACVVKMESFCICGVNPGM